MKKLFIFFIFLTIITSCSVMKTMNVYQSYYSATEESQAVRDLYSQIREHSVDSISLEKWLTLQAKTNEGYILQKSISSFPSDETSWKFIYTKHVVLDTSFYSVKVFLSTKDKKLQKIYGR